MKCPKCGTDNCQIITETNMKSKGFGAGKGCCGAIFFGPIGFLCGLCGMGKTKTTNQSFWICTNCSNKFKA